MSENRVPPWAAYALTAMGSIAVGGGVGTYTAPRTDAEVIGQVVRTSVTAALQPIVERLVRVESTVQSNAKVIDQRQPLYDRVTALEARVNQWEQLWRPRAKR